MMAGGDLRRRERGAWDHFVRRSLLHGERSCESAPGANVYRGARDAQYGALGRNSGVFAQVRYGL